MPSERKYEVIATLREAMDKRSVNLTDLAKLSGVPYRSLQNYFSGKTEMTASTFLHLCAHLGLDPNSVGNQKFKIEHAVLRRALINIVGDGLPSAQFTDDKSISLVQHKGDKRSEAQLFRDATVTTNFIEWAYDQDLERSLLDPLLDDDDEAGEGSSKGSPSDPT